MRPKLLSDNINLQHCSLKRCYQIKRMKMKMIKINKKMVILQVVCQIIQLQFQPQENQIIWVVVTTLITRITLTAYTYKQSVIYLENVLNGKE